jgi:hypothetical protein
MYGNTVQFKTAVGATNPSDGMAVDDLITVTTSTGFLTVRIDNLESDPSQISQVVSGFNFDLTSLAGSTTMSVDTTTPGATGSLIDKTNWSNAPVVDTTDSINHWSLTTTGTTTTSYSLSSILSGTADLIIGNPPSGGVYTNAKASITNCHACPFIEGSATFKLVSSGITTSTTINANTAFILFGTNLTGETVQVHVTTPEPSTLGYSLIGAFLMTAGLLRRTRKTAPLPVQATEGA